MCININKKSILYDYDEAFSASSKVGVDWIIKKLEGDTSGLNWVSAVERWVATNSNGFTHDRK